jgi:hypothetical protein
MLLGVNIRACPHLWKYCELYLFTDSTDFDLLFTE